MTQENKELLLKDLCARLPYNVMVNVEGYDTEKLIGIENETITTKATPTSYSDKGEYPIDIVKPFLRPMSNMTEEEYDDMFHQLYLGQEEFFRNCSNADTIGKIIGKDMVIYDFLTKKMFDFRCLIPKGLALVAPEGMYN